MRLYLFLHHDDESLSDNVQMRWMIAEEWYLYIRQRNGGYIASLSKHQ